MTPPDQQSSFTHICHTLKDRWPVESWFRRPIMIAVSGGADSVLLLRILIDLQQISEKKGEIIIAHVDHGTRDSSASDAEFIRLLAEQHGLQLVSRRIDMGALKERTASEDTLRQARYEQLMDMAHSCGARYLATGHNLEDQVETALFRIFRGTAFSGLQGIPPLRVDGAVSIVRPLLHVSRQTILAALKEIEQPFCEDPSNRESHYTRNFLRNEILPLLRTRFPAIDGSIIKLVDMATEFEHYLNGQAESLRASVSKNGDQELTLSKSELEQADPLVIGQFFNQLWQERGWPRQDMSREWWRKLTDLARQREGQVVLNLPGDIRVESDPRRLRIKTESSPC